MQADRDRPRVERPEGLQERYESGLDLNDAALDACDLIVHATGLAQSRSTAIQTTDGIRFRLPIVGHPPYKVFWAHTDDGPRVEAVFPHP